MNLREVDGDDTNGNCFRLRDCQHSCTRSRFRPQQSSDHVNVPGIRPDDQVLLTSHVPNNDADLSGSSLFCPFVERILPNAFVIFIHAFKGNPGNVTIRVDWAVLRNGNINNNPVERGLNS